MEAKQIKAAFDALKNDRNVVEQTWDFIEQFVVPFTGEMFKPQSSEGEMNWRRREIFDSTAIMAAQTLASSIHGAMTNPTSQWFDMRFKKSELQKNIEAAGWLEECNKRCFDAVQASNFNLEVSDLYLMLVSMGTGALTQEAVSEEVGDWQGFEFTNIVVRDIQFEQDHIGRPYRFYRYIQWTPLQIFDKFGEDTPADIKKKCDDPAQSTVKLDIIFCIYKRKKYEKTAAVIAPEKRMWGYKYVLHDDGSQIGKEGGYYEQPIYLPRWKRTSGSKWGYSPAIKCLSDILTINHLVEMILVAGEKAIDPPWIGKERNLLGDLNLRPGEYSVARDPDKIKPLESRARFDVGGLQWENLARSIRSAFHVDELELKDSPAMTATEVQVRYELMQRLLGPTLAQMKSDFMDLMVERTFKMMLRAGQLPDVPQIVKDSDPEIKIEYVGPLARSQKLDDVQSIERWLAGIMQMAEIRPEVLDIPNYDQIVRRMADQLNVPADSMNSEPQVAATRKQRQQEEQKMKQLAMLQQGGDAMKSVGEGAEAVKGVEGMEGMEGLQAVK